MKTDQEKIVKRLCSLAQLDVDAVLAYNQAIENIEEDDIRQTLIAFRQDHDRHIDELGGLIREMGGTAPALDRDVKGFFIEGMTAIASKMGTRGALMAMTSNEMLTNASYKAATALDLPSGVSSVIQRNYADEQRHLAYIKATLKDKFGMASDEDQEIRNRSATGSSSGVSF